MRNLKKLLAVVLTVVMIASMMVPALAANTYEEEALKLQSIGMFAGEPADLKLEEGVTRIQGLTFAIRAAGKIAEAEAMTDEEVTTILADWTDADTIPAWGLKYAAYAIKNTITLGLSATQKVFGALEPISGTSFLVFLMRSGMGYADVTTANVVDAAVAAGILTPGQAVTFGAKAALIRDDAAGILFGAAMNGVNADGTALIEALIASGFVSRDAALAAGFVEEVVPEDLEVVSVTALNLKQVQIVFNKAVDKTIAETIGNYIVKNNASDVLTDTASPNNAVASLQADGRTVIVTVEGGAADANKLSNLKNNYVEVAAGIKEAGTTKTLGTAYTNNSVNATDITAPQVQSVVVTGPKSFKVIFSEPIDDTTIVASDFKLNNGSIGLSSTIGKDDSANALLISSGSNLPAGTIKLTVNANSKATFADYAGIAVVKTDVEFTVGAVTGAPSVIIDTIAPNKVVLKFDRAVKNVANARIYHNYESNSTTTITAKAGIDGVYADTWEVVFPAGKYIPAGTQTLYVKNSKTASQVIEDKWGNKFTDTTLTAAIEADTTLPTVNDVKVENRKEIKVQFSENMNATDVVNRSLYTFKKASGATLKTSDFSNMTAYGHPTGAVLMNFNANTYVLTMTFSADFPVGDYTLTMKDIKDAAGYTENKLAEVEIAFTITNTNNPKLTSAVLKDGKIHLTFDKDMATSGAGSVLDTTNYQIDKAGSSGSTVALPSGTSIAIGNTSKEVIITLGSLTGINTGATEIYATVSAADGKPISATNNMKQLTGIATSGVVVGEIKSIKLVDKKTITFEVKQPLSGVDVSKISFAAIDAGTGGISADTASYVNETLEDGTYGAVVTVLVAASGTGDTLSTGLIDNKLDNIGSTADQTNNIVLLAGALTNELGATNAADILILPAGLTIADRAAPYLVSAATDDDDTNGMIDRLVLTFSEKIYAPSVQESDFEVDGYAVGSVESVSDNFVTLILDEKGFDTGVTPDVKIIGEILDSSSNRNAVSSSDFKTSADAAPPAVVVAITGQIAATNGTATVTFSEALNDASKTAVETAIDDGKVSGTLTFSWAGNVLTVTNTHATDPTAFAADISTAAAITDANSVSSAGVVKVVDLP